MYQGTCSIKALAIKVSPIPHTTEDTRKHSIASVHLEPFCAPNKFSTSGLTINIHAWTHATTCKVHVKIKIIDLPQTQLLHSRAHQNSCPRTGAHFLEAGKQQGKS